MSGSQKDNLFTFPVSKIRNRRVLDMNAANLAANDPYITPGYQKEKCLSCDKTFWAKRHNYHEVYIVGEANVPFCNS